MWTDPLHGLVRLAQDVGPTSRDKPGRIQAAVEIFYDVASNTVTKRNIHDEKVAKRWFPFLATMFLFIWFCNTVGFIPLPLNTEHTVGRLRPEPPDLRALRRHCKRRDSADARADRLDRRSGTKASTRKGPIGYVKGWVPAGTPKVILPIIFPVEALSQVPAARLADRPTLRQHARGPHDHPDHGRRNGRAARDPYIFPLTVPLAIFIYFLDVMLVTTLQAFIFTTLSAIYIGDAVSDSH